MNLPVLITRATGCEESIVENKTGIFIKNNPKDIAEKIEYYIQNPEMKIIHGREGRKFVKENFNHFHHLLVFLWEQDLNSFG